MNHCDVLLSGQIGTRVLANFTCLPHAVLNDSAHTEVKIRIGIERS